MNKKLTLIITIFILVFASGYYFFFYQKNKTTDTLNNNQTQTNTAINQPVKPQINPVVVSEQVKMNQIAIVFTETLGTYSNQSDYSSILGLKSICLPEMQKWLDTYVLKLKAGKITDPYKAMITRVITIESEKFNADKTNVSLVLNTQREEINNQQSKVFFQKMNIDLIKDNSGWKVNNAAWEKK